MSFNPEHINIHKNWRNHQLVTDEMVVELKKVCECKSNESLMEVQSRDHERILGKLPEGAVAWLKVDRRLPMMNMYSLDKDRVVYTTPCGTKLN